MYVCNETMHFGRIYLIFVNLTHLMIYSSRLAQHGCLTDFTPLSRVQMRNNVQTTSKLNKLMLKRISDLYPRQKAIICENPLLYDQRSLELFKEGSKRYWHCIFKVLSLKCYQMYVLCVKN